MSQQQNEKDNQVAIVGLGCRYPGAKSPKELWQNVLARRVQFREIPDCRLPLSEYYSADRNAEDKTYGTRAAVIDDYEFDWSTKRIPKTTYESTDIAHWLALDTTIKMLEDTTHGTKSIPKERTSVIIGNTLTGEFTRAGTMRLRWPYVKKALQKTAKQCGIGASEFAVLESRMETHFKSVFPPTTEDTLAGGLANTIAGRICNYFDLNGGGYIVDGACSSSIIAIYTAASQLTSNMVDFVIAGGVDISLDPFELIGFAKTGALTEDEMRVYDRRGKGFIPGEGCGIVGLKRLADAERDGDKIYAVLKGWGISSDGKGGITAPSANGQSIAMRRAYDGAKFDVSNLDFIEGHGTGTAVGDRIEIQGISKALSENETVVPDRNCGLTSFKSLVGHTKAAAGVGAFIKTVIAVNQRILPPTSGCDIPHAEFSDNAKMLYPIRYGKVCAENTILNAGVSAMGFGGINSHLLLSSGPKVYQHLKSDIPAEELFASKQNSELFVFDAKNATGLLENIVKLIPDIKKASYAELTDIAADLAIKNGIRESKNTIGVRAAIVGSTPYQFVERMNLLVDKLEIIISENTDNINDLSSVLNDISPTDNIWLVFAKPSVRIGYVFPGQGSQQVNIARNLIRRYSWAKALVKYAGECYKEAGESRVIDILFPEQNKCVSEEEKLQNEMELKETEIAQPALVLCSLLWLKYLEKLGLSADAVMGHSLGELVAFFAAGCFDEKTLFKLAIMRGKQMAESSDGVKGAMVSLVCDQIKTKVLMSLVNAKFKSKIVVANLNSERQTVVSGVEEAVDELIAIASGESVRAVKLSVSNAFHSPLVDAASKYLLTC